MATKKKAEITVLKGNAGENRMRLAKMVHELIAGHCKPYYTDICPWTKCACSTNCPAAWFMAQKFFDEKFLV
jgi:hypothetical protein